MKKNAFFTFCFALLPGCGQMYQGYMKRGGSLLFWFCGLVALVALTGVEGLLFLLPVIWAYSFFDTFNIRNLSDEQRAAMGDFFLPSVLWFKGAGGWLGRLRPQKLLGWALIIVGILTLYGSLWNTLYAYVWNYVPSLAVWMDRLPALVIAVVVIVLGVRMLRGHWGPKDEDVGPYEGGDEDA